MLTLQGRRHQLTSTACRVLPMPAYASFLSSCVQHVDAHARVEIKTQRRDVVQVTVLKSDARRFVALDLDGVVCGGGGGGGAAGSSPGGAGAGAGGSSGGGGGPDAERNNMDGDGEKEAPGRREEDVSGCFTEEEYRLEIRDKYAVIRSTAPTQVGDVLMFETADWSVCRAYSEVSLTRV